MGISLFIQQNQRNKIEALEIDMTISENHEFTNNVTSYPVDVGFNITDHVKPQPPKLTLVGLTSETPVQYFSGQIGNLVKSDLTNRVNETFRLLLNYAGFQVPKHGGADSLRPINPSLLTIVTGYTIYRNMVVQQINFPREKATGRSIQYNLTLVHIRKVSALYSVIDNTSSKVPNAKTQAAETINTGKNTTEIVTEESIPYKGLTFLKGLIQ